MSANYLVPCRFAREDVVNSYLRRHEAEVLRSRRVGRKLRTMRTNLINCTAESRISVWMTGVCGAAEGSSGELARLEVREVWRRRGSRGAGENFRPASIGRFDRRVPIKNRLSRPERAPPFRRGSSEFFLINPHPGEKYFGMPNPTFFAYISLGRGGRIFVARNAWTGRKKFGKVSVVSFESVLFIEQSSCFNNAFTINVTIFSIKLPKKKHYITRKTQVKSLFIVPTIWCNDKGRAPILLRLYRDYRFTARLALRIHNAWMNPLNTFSSYL